MRSATIWRRDSAIEALALTSMDLGYGDGGGWYVMQVYGRRDAESFPVLVQS